MIREAVVFNGTDTTDMTVMKMTTKVYSRVALRSKSVPAADRPPADAMLLNKIDSVSNGVYVSSRWVPFKTYIYTNSSLSGISRSIIREKM
ncbi:uncharacterized [Tachysurus ichikawai]